MVIGLDGATWTILDPLIDAGKLPTFQRLRDKGRAGPLTSTRPPVTFPAWKVISSGRPPEHLGVHGIRGVDFMARQFTYPDARTFNTAEAWDYMADEGLQVATVNMPSTWPVREIGKGSVMVGDPFARDEATVAPESAREAYDIGPYTTRGIPTFRKDPDTAFDFLTEIEGERFAISHQLAPEVDVLFHTVFSCDPIQHFHWHDAAMIERTWRWIDEQVGRLLEATDPKHVIVCSDHGFIPIERQFNVNTWLQQEGLLSLSGTETTSLLYKLGLTRERLMAPFKALGITEEQLGKLVPSPLKRRVPNQQGERLVGRWEVVEWHATRALSADGYQVFVRDDGARQQVVEGLTQVTVPGTDEPFFQDVIDMKAASGDPQAPVAITPRDGFYTGHTFGGPLWKTKGFSGGWIATHAMDGVGIVHGRGIEPGRLQANLVDIAPTTLALTGCKIPTTMQGGLLVEDLEPPGTREPLGPVFQGSTGPNTYGAPS